jgi:hypothetical protein
VTPSVRLYRLLLRLYPSGIRDRFGDDMTLLFADQLRDAEGSPQLIVELWLRTLGDVAATSSEASDDAMPAEIVDGVSWTRIAASRRRARSILLVGAVATAAGIVAQGAMAARGPCFGCDDGRIAGLPASLVIPVVAIAVMLAGLAWMWRIYRAPAVFRETRWRYRAR